MLCASGQCQIASGHELQYLPAEKVAASRCNTKSKICVLFARPPTHTQLPHCCGGCCYGYCFSGGVFAIEYSVRPQLLIYEHSSHLFNALAHQFERMYKSISAASCAPPSSTHVNECVSMCLPWWGRRTEEISLELVFNVLAHRATRPPSSVHPRSLLYLSCDLSLCMVKTVNPFVRTFSARACRPAAARRCSATKSE